MKLPKPRIVKLKRTVPIGAWERTKIGMTSTAVLVGGKKLIYFLAHKFHISKHKCPQCGSRRTFHSIRVRDLEPRLRRTGMFYENTLREITGDKAFLNTRMIGKYDLCLKCGHEWLFEMFCWELHEKHKKLASRLVRIK